MTGETRGTETSKYPQEKKEKSILLVAASESGRAQTEGRNTIGVTDYIIDSTRWFECYGKSNQRRWQSCKRSQVDKIVSRVPQDTRNLVGSRRDHPPRLNTPRWPIEISTVRERWKEPREGSEKNLKPYVYKQIESIKARYRTFCRTVQRVMVCSEVKHWRCGAKGKPSLNRAKKLHDIDPKPGDLSMARLKPE